MSVIKIIIIVLFMPLLLYTDVYTTLLFYLFIYLFIYLHKAVNSSGAKPGSAVLCWLVVRFVAVITAFN